MSATLTDMSLPVMEGSAGIGIGISAPNGDPAAGSDFHAHLQRFVVAKSQIISIYKEMSTYVTDVNKYVLLQFFLNL